MEMTADNASITGQELREAFQRSGLWRRGWTYERAKQAEAVLLSLVATVRARHRSQQRGDVKQKAQADLPLGIA